MGNDNAITRQFENVRAPVANTGGAAPQSGKTQTDGLLRGGWNELAQNLVAAYGISRIAASAPAASTSDRVVSETQTPQTVITARPAGAAGFITSPMGLMVLAAVAVGAFLLLRK